MNDYNRMSPRILFITGGVPWPVHMGVNQRTHLLLRALREYGTVDTVIHSRYAALSDADLEYLRDNYGVVTRFVQQAPGERWPWRLAGRVSKPLASRLGTHIGGMGLWYRPQTDIGRWLAGRLQERRYDLIVGRYLRVLASSGALSYQPVVLDLDDFDSSTHRSRLQQPGLSTLQRYSIRRQVRQVESVVPRLLRRCDHIWVASRADQDLLNSLPTSVLPNIPFESDDTEPVAPCEPRPESKIVLTVGSLRHTVNVKAIDRFLEAAWPRVHARVPESEFRIVGFGMTDSQKRRWGGVAGVAPVGFAADLRREYDRCAFSVVPIFEGGGTKIKVLESLRHGRTLVGAAHSCRGYEDTLRHLETLWVAQDEGAIIEGCVRLLREPNLRHEMAERGCELVRRNYSYERVKQVVAETMDRITAQWKGVQARQPA